MITLRLNSSNFFFVLIILKFEKKEKNVLFLKRVEKQKAEYDRIVRTSKEIKLKRKLESIGIAALCLSIDNNSFENPIFNLCKLD
jgi:hypothetical protein